MNEELIYKKDNKIIRYEKDSRLVVYKTSSKVEMHCFIPHDWAITRIMQFMESLINSKLV